MANDVSWNVAPMLGVRDVVKAVEYFRSALGFECGTNDIFEGVGDEPAVYAIVKRSGVSLHLQIRRRPLDHEGRHAHECDAYLYVGNVDELYEEYRQKNVKIYRPLQDESYGVRDFTIETPDGHRLAFGTLAST